jgi:hypothetical protein
MKYDGRVCKFNMDTGCVELRLRDGRMISIDCTGLEDELDVTMAQRSELDYLIYSKPFAQKARARAAETAAGCGLSAPFRGLFVSGRQRFLKTQPNCKKSYNFLIKKGGFPLTALL